MQLLKIASNDWIFGKIKPGDQCGHFIFTSVDLFRLLLEVEMHVPKGKLTRLNFNQKMAPTAQSSKCQGALHKKD